MTLAVNLAQGASNNVAFRNRIINGAMVLDQRNAGASVTVNSSNNNPNTLDRFAAYNVNAGSGTFTQQQSTTVPAGFVNSLLTTVGTADTPTGNVGYSMYQRIEGLNISDLNWGTADASTVTLSFWVRSSITGNFPVLLQNSGSVVYYATLYNIPTANTWTKISITITGPTTGTWLTTNGIGIDVNWGFGAGSGRTAGTTGAWTSNPTSGTILLNVTGATQLIGTSGATFYITGVQLEAGTTASPFDYRPYGTELALCQRYYFQSANINDGTQFYAIHGYVASGGNVRWFFKIPVPMRTTPSIALNPVYNTGSSWQANLTGINNYAFTAAPSIGNYDGGLQLSISQNISAISASYYTFNVILYPTTSVNTNNFQISAEL